MAYEIAIAVGGIGAAGLFLFLSIQMSKQHGALQILFMFMGLYLIGLTLGSVNEIAIAESSPAVTIKLIQTCITTVTWTIYISMSYFMIMFLWGVMRTMLPWGKNKKGR